MLLGLIAVFIIHGALQSHQCFAASECKTVATDELASSDDPLRIPSAPVKGAFRIATYNVSLHRKQSGELRKDLEGDSEQAKRLATIVQTLQPDILVINEIDFEPDLASIELFRTKYLNQAKGLGVRGSTQPFAYQFAAAVNTGVPSGLDLNQNQKTDEADDCFGFGNYPGQYGMAIYSRHPIQQDKCRTFQKLLWSSMPNAQQPKTESGKNYYPDDVWTKLRLSSKSHWDVLIDFQGKPLHVLMSHPTPPVFDGPEDRNGCRNHDEIRFWSDYLDNEQASGYVVDDQGVKGGLANDQAFVICGDLNSDPKDGAGNPAAILRLMSHPRVLKMEPPKSQGAIEASDKQAGANKKHQAPAEHDTADFNDRSSGNLRCDFVLPSVNWKVLGSGVFWPTIDQISAFDKDLLEASDHRLVWVDLAPR